SMRNGIAVSAAACVGLAASMGAQALDFQNASGTVTGSWDTTVSFGQAWRLEDPDCRLIATANGGCGRSPNIDDGNLNYVEDVFSRAFKVVTELSIESGQFGAFVRGSGLYDAQVEDEETDRTRLPGASKDLVG